MLIDIIRQVNQYMYLPPKQQDSYPTVDLIQLIQMFDTEPVNVSALLITQIQETTPTSIADREMVHLITRAVSVSSDPTNLRTGSVIMYHQSTNVPSVTR